jgi:hypothetical protein
LFLHFPPKNSFGNKTIFIGRVIQLKLKFHIKRPMGAQKEISEISKTMIGQIKVQKIRFRSSLQKINVFEKYQPHQEILIQRKKFSTKNILS